MRGVVQRISEAEVRVDGRAVGSCARGLAVLVAAHRDDGPEQVRKFADKLVNLRIFNDAEGKMNLSIRQLESPPAMLVVSNFTLYGDASKNRRPSFTESAAYDQAKELYELLIHELEDLGVAVGAGRFGAHMEVRLVGDGPVTLIVDVPPGS